QVDAAEGVDGAAEPGEVDLHDVADGDAEVGLDGLDQQCRAAVVRRVDPVELAECCDVLPDLRHQGVPGDGDDGDLLGRRVDVPDHHHVAALAADQRGCAVGRCPLLVAHPRIGADDQHVERLPCDLLLLAGHVDLGDLVVAVPGVPVEAADDQQDQDDEGDDRGEDLPPGAPATPTPAARAAAATAATAPTTSTPASPTATTRPAPGANGVTGLELVGEGAPPLRVGDRAGVGRAAAGMRTEAGHSVLVG